MQLNDTRVLITGGAGLVGSHIADLLLKENASEIVIFDDFVRGRLENLAQALPSGRVRVVHGDIRNREQLREAMQGIDVVFHQAAIRITQCAAEPRLAFEVLAEGTFNVLESAVAAGAKKIVAASSASVYGQAEAFPTAETHHPYNNRTIYGALKTLNEGLLRSFNEMYGLAYTALRYFNVYGPRMDIHGFYTEVLIRWMERIDAGESPLIFGDGTQTMDFVYIGDVARANILAAASDVTDDTLNVASGEETSLAGLLKLLLHVMNSSLEPEHRPARAVAEVQRRLADTAKARSLIGFESRVSLEDGLRLLVDWWRTAKRERPATQQ